MYIYTWKWQYHLQSLNIYQAIDSELVIYMKDEKVFEYIEVEKELKFQISKLLESLRGVIAYLLHKGSAS